MTPVKTTFFVERVKNIPKFDVCFTCQQESGVLQPYERHRIPVSSVLTTIKLISNIITSFYLR
jgi:hypothetical protein